MCKASASSNWPVYASPPVGGSVFVMVSGFDVSDISLVDNLLYPSFVTRGKW
ncbi:MAG: hypothetical protein LBS16_00740 [Prevotellaceae bacterium]|jgi:hypothetical protein|nr:hypothetical protein [Prevotellaceae bacterium]